MNANCDASPQNDRSESTSSSSWPDCTPKHVRRVFRDVSSQNLCNLLLHLLAGNSLSSGIIEHIERKLEGREFSAHDAAVHQWFKRAKQAPSWALLATALDKSNENYLAYQIEEKDNSLFVDLNEIKSQSSSSEDSSTSVNMKDAIEELEDEFRTIRIEFQTFLESNKAKCNYFCEFLKDPIETLTGLEKYFSEKDLEDGNLKDIFKKMKDNVWNFIDFEVLSTLIKRCGGPEELITKMKRYERKVSNLCDDITVDELVRYWNPPVFAQDIPESFKTCIAKMPWDPKKCKVEELRILKRRFETLIPQRIGMAAYTLVYVLDQSVTAIWLVFTNVWPQLINGVHELIQGSSNFIEEVQLSSFVFDDFIFHPCTDQEELWNACREGATGVVQRLLNDARVDPNQIYEVFQRTALQCAAKYGQQNNAELLLEYGANINHQDMKGFTALMIAVRAGQAGMVEYLLSKGAGVDIQEEVCGMSPLLAAVESNDICLFMLCKDHHANLNARNKDGKTALIIAAERGNEDLVSLLLTEGEQVIEVEAQDVHGQTAVHAAVTCGYIKIVEILLKYPQAVFFKDKNHDTPRDIAEKSEQWEVVDLFKLHFGEDELSVGEESSVVESHEIGSYDVMPQEEDEPRIIEPQTIDQCEEAAAIEPAMELPDIDRPSIVEEIKESGSRLRRVGRVLQSAIHGGTINIRLLRAAKNGNPRLVDVLLQDGANPNTKGWDTQRWTVLMWTTNKGHLEVVKVLMRNGADPNIKALLTGYTALTMASQKGYHEIVECILNPQNPIKVDIAAMNADPDWGPLMWASQTRGGSEVQSQKGKENRRKVVEHLIKAGADVNKPSTNGWTPLMQASQDNHLELVQMFCKDESVDLDHASKSTWTAITTACRKGIKHEEIIIELTKAGADINKKKKGGLTALHLACYRGLLKAVKFMVPSLKESIQGHQRKGDVNIQDDWGMTPLMFAVKQEHKELAKYLIIEGGADVNIRAMKYAQWTAVFFAIANEDEETLDALVENNADMEILDEYRVSPIAFSKGIWKKQIYKHMKKREQQLQQQGQPQVEGSKAPSGKSYNPVDLFRYTSTETVWRARQQMNITLNV